MFQIRRDPFTTPDLAVMPITPSSQVIAELAPTGVLRAAINMGNFLLVTGKDPKTAVSDLVAAGEHPALRHGRG